MSERGSGRTTRQLAALPDGGAYLVHTMKMADYCRCVLRESGRDPKVIRFFTACQPEGAIWGVRLHEWDVDHAYFRLAGTRGQRSYDLMGMAAGKGPLFTP